ncbi:alpha-amylase family glycosyl hydrolase [Rosettibacter firmus]|uniref:alpha-amylase family glycosyl hydrolase n=1 Tax=Rosettibacter firmus TaxID=3111522 RepID=UPI00336C2D87
MKKELTQIKCKYYSDEFFSQRVFPKYEFHIAKEIRKKYEFSDEIFSITGNVIFVDFQSVRLFVHKINSKRKLEDHIQAGKLNASALIDEIYHYLCRQYEFHVNPGVYQRALDYLQNELGEKELNKILFEFVDLFPPLNVFKNEINVIDYLNSYTEGKSNLEITLEELILLYFANLNPANKNIIELFDENYFSNRHLYKKIISALESFFVNEKKFGIDNQDLFTFFKTPILVAPDNVEAQLDFIREKWGVLLDEKFIQKILRSKDFIKEEYGPVIGGGPPPLIPPQYKSKISDADLLTLGKSAYKYAYDITKDYEEPEQFTLDTDWMPNVIMIAKNTYVWLDQLSKKYQREIRRLDQIPDEELEQLSRWGFNALWLIGIWERSSASRKIKHLMGNIDATASAYSIYDYQIANDLGGEEAFQNLSSRAKKFGIRLASDMVPNHTGIFSKWIVEHPEYFIQTKQPPFPNYTFSGPDLSDDPSIQIRIEDGYWTRTDAAVVFERIDNRTGERIYIYHGNDGTKMPWNDTAQLNMLLPEVREAVIQKIFDVARKFPIIRFDAAMTLTKRHFSRLWYPEPGTGGDIPSRTDFSMTKEEFDKLFPVEFWREVVDRINAELPDTLLLAEAFWLLEGYFVRSLGMHRVYNSAFMNMLMREENEKFRDLITNTLEFEPEILKRYVNFMSNPDEETAIKQFGTDDKYFGVCTLMVTLPGLPLFAHGQIEGFIEKYGMEYQKAYYHETPNQYLIERHQKEIFPLMKKRYLFSNIENFWFYDFIDNFGHINENVFAFSNYVNEERVIVIYNNKFENTAGKIFRSTPKLISVNNKKEIYTKTLASALNLKRSKEYYYIYRDHVTNLEYLRSGFDFEIEGLYVELGAFKYAVYLDFREVYDEYGDWEKLYRRLKGVGVPNVARALIEMKLEPIHIAFENMFDDEILNNFIKACVSGDNEKLQESIRIKFIDKKYYRLLNIINSHLNLNQDIKPILKNFDKEIFALQKLNQILDLFFPVEEIPVNLELHKAIITNKERNYREDSIIFVLWLIVSNISLLFEDEGDVNKKNYINKILLDTPIRNVLKKLGRGEYDIYRSMLLINILQEIYSGVIELFCIRKTDYEESYSTRIELGCIEKLLQNENVKLFIGVNEYENIIYYSKENFEELLDWLLTLSILENLILILLEKNPQTKDDFEKLYPEIVELIKHAYQKYQKIKKLSDDSGYKLMTFIDSLKEISISSSN